MTRYGFRGCCSLAGKLSQMIESTSTTSASIGKAVHLRKKTQIRSGFFITDVRRDLITCCDQLNLTIFFRVSMRDRYISRRRADNLDMNPLVSIRDVSSSISMVCLKSVFEGPAYLIMDEMPNIFSHPTFWGNLMSGAQVCRVLAFGAFGLFAAGNDRSPPQFQQKWYYDDVKFTDQECMELVDSFDWVGNRQASFRRMLRCGVHISMSRLV